MRKRIAVMVPAHDEGLGLHRTIASILKQFHPGDRVLVVADNCSDDTAAVAVASGADVVERNDQKKLGKVMRWIGVCDISVQPSA